MRGKEERESESVNVRGKAERKGSRERQLDQRKAWLEQEKIMTRAGERKGEQVCVGPGSAAQPEAVGTKQLAPEILCCCLQASLLLAYCIV